MNSIILTGSNRGLGKEIHDLLICGKNFDNKYYFISRNPVPNPDSRYEYLGIDFNRIDKIESLINLDSSNEAVVLINNASTIDPIEKSCNLVLSELENTIRVNCIAPLGLARALAIRTEEINAKLLIINITSGASKRPIQGWMAYCVSKAAAVMALDVLALENRHVKLIHFDPGVMDTDMQRMIRLQLPDTMPDVNTFKKFKDELLLKQPREVAKKILSIIKEIVA